MSGRRKVLATLISLLAAVALGGSAYLTWVTWQSGTVAGCTAETLFDCDEVLSSRWSKWLGLPVSLLGAVTYLALLGLSWPAAIRPRGVAITALFGLALLAAGAAVWFVGLQVIQLHSYCFYCLTVHCCGLLIGGLAFLLFIDSHRVSDVDQMRSLLGVAADDSNANIQRVPSDISGLALLASLGVAAAGLFGLMAGQLLSEPAATMVMEELDLQPLATSTLESRAAEIATSDGPAAASITPADLPEHDAEQPKTATTASMDDLDWLETKSESRTEPIVFQNEPLATVDSLFGSAPDAGAGATSALAAGIDVTSLPMLGSPQSEHVIIELMDYTCKHCRELHPYLRAALERYDGQIRVAIHHVPLSKNCNPNVLKHYPGKKYACDYAQLAMAVWSLAPEEFSGFHDWLLESEKPPNITKARSRAVSLVGGKVFDPKIKADISQRLTTHASTLKRLTGGLPVLLLSTGALRGVPDRNETLFDYLESRLGVERPQSAD